MIKKDQKTQLLIVRVVKSDCNSIKFDLSIPRPISIEIDDKSITIFAVALIIAFVIVKSAVTQTFEVDCKSINFSTSRSRSIDLWTSTSFFVATMNHDSNQINRDQVDHDSIESNYDSNEHDRESNDFDHDVNHDFVD